MTAKDISTGKPSDKLIRQMEQHWLETCKTFGVSPVTARWVYFDQKQQRPSSRYWSHVIDQRPFPEQAEAMAA